MGWIVVLLLGHLAFFAIFIIFRASRIFENFRFSRFSKFSQFPNFSEFLEFPYYQTFQSFKHLQNFPTFQNLPVFQISKLLLEFIKPQKVINTFPIFIGFSCFCPSYFNFTSGPVITWLRLVVCKTWFYLLLQLKFYTSIHVHRMPRATTVFHGDPARQMTLQKTFFLPEL